MSASFHDRDLVERLRVDYVCDEHTWQELESFHVRNEAADEITRLRQRVRDLDQALSDAEHRLTWGHH